MSQPNAGQNLNPNPNNEAQVNAAKAEAAKFRGIHERTLVKEAVLQAAAEAGAVHPHQFESVFSSTAKVYWEGENGDKARVVVNRNGREQSIAESIAEYKKDKDWSNMFKETISGSGAGTGSLGSSSGSARGAAPAGPDPTTGRYTEQQISVMSMDEYIKVRKSNPRALGFGK